MKEKMKMVKCKYPQCSKLHSSKILPKKEAIKGNNGSYYHADCYHYTRTITEVKDLFYKKLNPVMTGKQVSELMSTINNIVFDKKVDVDFLRFALEYYIKHQLGNINYPHGLHYIIQNRTIISQWNHFNKIETEKEVKEQMKKLIAEEEERDLSTDQGLELNNNSNTYKRKNKFSSVLGV